MDPARCVSDARPVKKPAGAIPARYAALTASLPLLPLGLDRGGYRAFRPTGAVVTRTVSS
jgi:hypothetical protein